ncbi:MAG: hypothetical protein MJ252_24490 [archaeon]|nr:hypothetical protein [archaeon]
MLQFCTDICLFLIRNPTSVATIHCKAGKGRAGMMAVCYLVFSGLCKNSQEALDHYAKQRTQNCKGVTIPSQKRYIQYFEAFLTSHFVFPYYKGIPLIKAQFLPDTIYNILRDYLNRTDYFYTVNSFHFKSVRIGPFKKRKDCQIQFSSLNISKMGFEKCKSKITQEGNGYIITMDLNEGPSFNYDVKMTVSCFWFNFYTWVNLYYATLENLSAHIAKVLGVSHSNEDGGKKSFTSLGEHAMNRDQAPTTNDIITAEPTYEDSKEEIIDTSTKKTKFVEPEKPAKKKVGFAAGPAEPKAKPKKKNNALVSATTMFHTRDANVSTNPQSQTLKGTLSKMIENFKSNQNLIQLIETFNLDADINKVPMFNYKDQKVKMKKEELDKFKDKLGIVDKNSFGVEFHFELEETREAAMFGEDISYLNNPKNAK